MFHTFSLEPPRPQPQDVLKEVEDILDARGLTFGTLIISALGETTSSLGAAVVTELPSILEALRPHFDEDEKARALLGEFFASVASPELLQFEKGDDEMSWSLPAISLSPEKLMGFSLDAMGRKIASAAPGLSSFLDGICNKRKLDDCDMDVDEDTEDMESDSESETEARQKASPEQLLKIVSLFAHCILVVHCAIEEGYHYEHCPEHAQSEVQCISGHNRCFSPFDTHAGPCHTCSPSRRYQHFFVKHITRHQIHVSKDSRIAHYTWRGPPSSLRLRQLRHTDEALDPNPREER